MGEAKGVRSYTNTSRVIKTRPLTQKVRATVKNAAIEMLQRRKAAQTPIKPGRNDLCPCVSCKKYKHCCDEK